MSWTVRTGKYNARKTIVDGITFDSRKEANYYCELKLLRRGGQVRSIECQVPFELVPGFRYKKKYIRPITYVADFRVEYSDGHVEIVDVKGYKTKEYLLKKKMLLYKYPEIDFREV